MADSLIKEITTETFPEVVVGASSPVLVAFYAGLGATRSCSCGLEALALEYKGRLLITKVNTENDPALAAAFGIRSFPTWLFYLEGCPQGLMSGSMTTAQLRGWIGEHLLKEAGIGG